MCSRKGVWPTHIRRTVYACISHWYQEQLKKQSEGGPLERTRRKTHTSNLLRILNRMMIQKGRHLYLSLLFVLSCQPAAIICDNYPMIRINIPVPTPEAIIVHTNPTAPQDPNKPFQVTTVFKCSPQGATTGQTFTHAHSLEALRLARACARKNREGTACDDVTTAIGPCVVVERKTNP